MKIINPSVREDIKSNQPLRLDLGCGSVTQKGFYGLDVREMKGVDVVADLNKPLTMFPDNSVIEIYSHHVLEHISDFPNLMSELYRIVRANGRIKIVVPHFSYPLGYSDPTHVRFFGFYSMYYFVDHDSQPRRKVPNFYTNIRFRVESVHIKFARAGLDKWVGPVMERIVNVNDRTRACYERHFCYLWPASEIIYVISPDKCSKPKDVLDLRSSAVKTIEL